MAGFCTAILLAACLVLSGCGGGGESAGTRKQQSTSAGVDDVLQAGVEEYDSAAQKDAGSSDAADNNAAGADDAADNNAAGTDGAAQNKADGTQASSQPGAGVDNNDAGSDGAVPVQASGDNGASAGSGNGTSDGTADGKSDGTAEDGNIASGEVDVDLTAMSSTIVYSEVFNMVSNPDSYIGKTVRMEGPCSIYTDESSGVSYYACIIRDATACCAQGMEFELDETYERPDDYPGEGEEVVVEGTFDTYMEGEYLYCTLRDARLVGE